MSYSQLLKLRESIEKMQSFSPMYELNQQMRELCGIERNSTVVDKKFLEDTEFMMTEIGFDIEIFNRHLKDYAELIDDTLLHQTFDLIREDNIHYEQPNVKYKTADYNRTYQNLKVSEETRKVIQARMGMYTNWKFPGLEIGPGDGEWTRDLVALDPLYIVDHNDEFLESTKQTFNAQYQKRLRCYLNNGKSLHMLPQNQFGFVFSWNTFNYFSLNQIKAYLIEIRNVLRPGGACMFSYNNGERPLCAQRSEEHLMSFVPETILRKVVRSLDFINIRTENMDSTVSWIEFRKPGCIHTTAKAGQALGKIILKHHVEA